VADGNTTDTVLTFNTGDVLTLLGVTQSEFTSLNGTEFVGNSYTGPTLNGFALTVSEGGTTVLSNSDFAVSDLGGSTNFIYSVSVPTHGIFEVFNGQNWVTAATGGFTTAQIAAGDVRFVQDGTNAVPTFTIQVSDGSNVSPAISPTITFSGPAVPDVWASDTSGSWSNPANWSNGAVPGVNDLAEVNYGNITATIYSAAAVGSLASSATINIKPEASLYISGNGGDSSNSGALDVNGALIVNSADFNNGSTGSINVEGGGALLVNAVSIDGGTVTNNGAIIVNGSSAIQGALRSSGVDTEVNILSGTLELSGVESLAGGFNLANGTSLELDGLATVNGFAAFLGGALTGSGSLTLANGAQVEISSSVAGPSINFNSGAAELALDNPSTFGGTIENLAIGDELYLANVDVVSAVMTSPTTLTISELNGSQLTYQVSGSVPGVFSVVSSSASGSQIALVSTSNAYSSGQQTYTSSSSQFYKLAGASIVGSGLNIHSSDTVATDYAEVELDSTSSLSATQSNAPAVIVGSAGAAIDIFSEVPNISSAYVGIDAVESGAGGITVNANGNINSASTGIAAINNNISSENTFVSVLATGTITVGSVTQSSQSADGIWAGFGNGSAFHSAVTGTVLVNNFANITATAASSSGIVAFDNANGNVSVNDEAGTSVSGNLYGIEANAGTTAGNGDTSGSGDVSILLGQNAQVSSATSYGILAQNTNPVEGNISVVMSAGDTITSAGAGVNAVDKAGSLSNGSIFVSSAGTIDSGVTLTGSNSPPAGVLAGYFGNGTTTPTSSPGVFGNVVVDNTANIMAGFSNGALITTGVSDGIRAYNYGTGDVTVNDNAGTIEASYGLTTGTNGYGDGINASNNGSGDIYVTTTAGVTIESAGAGIAANNASSSVPSTSEIDVVAYGTIMSGVLLTGSGKVTAGILAGYNSNSGTSLATPGVHGNVIIDDHASITAATGTDGIRGYTYGDGDVTITVESDSTVNGPRYGVAGFTYDGGDISVTNYGSVTGGTDAIDINVQTGNPPPSGTATLDNHGHLIGDIAAYNTTFTNASGGDWSMNGTSAFTGASTFNNAGTVESNGSSIVSGLSSITNTGTIEVQSGSLDLNGTVSGIGTLKIDAGATLELSSGTSSDQTVVFNSTTGTLKIDDLAHFSSDISGLSGSDGIDLTGYDINTIDLVVNSTTASTVLTVSDATHTTPLNITLLGDYTHSTFTPSIDSTNSGVNIVDPPAPAGPGPVIMNDPGPAASQTVVASSPNQTLTGTGSSDNFVFNFAGVGKDAVTNFHPTTDTLQFSSSIFANAQAALNATQDDGHGNTVVALDAHDSITLTGVLKAQLHVADFHVV
jgi:hypothetical protein